MTADGHSGRWFTEGELDALIGHVARGVSPPREGPFFEHLVAGLARALEADHVSVGEVVGTEGEHVRTLALFSDGAIRSNIVYPLEHSPCEQILTAGICVYPEHVDRLFPRDPWLVENGIHGYVGAALYDSNGAVIGTLAVMFRRPVTQQRLSRQLAQIFGERAAVELERQRRRQELEQRNQALLLLNDLADQTHRSLNRGRLAHQTLSTVIHHGLAPAALLYLCDPDSSDLYLASWRGIDDERIGDLGSLPTLTRHVGTWESGSPWIMDACPGGPPASLRSSLARLDARDATVIPLTYMGRRLGALELLYPEPRDHDPVELDTLRSVGRTLSLALVNADQFTEIEYQALHDPLTGLPNRKHFHHEAKRYLVEHRGNRSSVLMLLDIRRFGEINNTLGHHTGDTLLREVAARLRATLADRTLLCRLGGDEFAILIPADDEADETWIEAQTLRILTAVNQPFDLGGTHLEVHCSIGIALSPEHARDSHSLLRCADVALQRAKQQPGEPVMTYEQDFDEQNPLRLAMMTDLTTAIRQNQLMLRFQPKVRLSDGALSGMEALVRWQHPRLGFIPPGRFIPLVEMTDLIRPLTFWVLEKTLEHIRGWLRSGLDVPVSVNLSPRLLTDPALPEYLGSLLRRHGIAPHLLELEITESALMADPGKALAVANQIAALGVDLSIDDFGTGYSSLSYLKRLPLKALKIDRSFVAEMLDSEHDAIIVRSTIGLAHSLGLRVVAEGIEDQAAFHALRDMGCDEGQGYCIAHPETAAQVQTRLTGKASRLPDDPCEPA